MDKLVDLSNEHLMRPRRLRRNARMRALVGETHLRPGMLMQPYFVVEGTKRAHEIRALPGIEQLSSDMLLSRVERAVKAGLKQVLLFGVVDEHKKDLDGAIARDPEGPVPKAVEALRRAFGDELLIATDVCLCGVLEHGHCGIVQGDSVDNDRSLLPLSAMATAHAQAGADIVAPSDMMDGRVLAIRRALRAAGCDDVAVMSYSVKYASAYYGPFREAAKNTPAKGDRKSYQMDPRNRREALREALLDTAEGADMLMVKPALAYLDVISEVRRHTQLPLACYNVSGEYALVKAAAAQNLVDEGRMVFENLVAMARAGADLLITYHATEALERGWLL